MYNFVDVNEASEGFVLPSEALKINGEYIENQIAGYRTLHVQGREALSPDISTFETGVRDGSKLKYKRYPERVITVTYQIKAETNEAFRNAYNKLASILDVTDAELIFEDEQDKFFVGTPSTIGAVSPGTNSVIGEFEIVCADPFKYSMIEYEAAPVLDDTSILIDYNGTYKAYPTLEADFYSETEVDDDGETAGTLTGTGDCGYVAFFTEDEKIIQLGDPDEVDGSALAKSQTLVNQTFLSSTSWGTTAKSLWAVNSGTVLPSTVQQSGTVAMKAPSADTGTGGETSATLLSVRSTANSPAIDYTVVAKTHGRSATTVNVTFSITAALGSSGSYFGRGYILYGEITITGSTHTVLLKDSSDYWQGNSGHTKSFTITLTSEVGITASTTSVSGIKFRAYRGDSLGTAGVLASTNCNTLAISPYATSTVDSYYLAASSSGTASGKWHGPSITRTIGADASGEVGANNFTFTYSQQLCGSKVSQMGGFQVQLTAADGTHIAGVRIYKNTSGYVGTLVLYVHGVAVCQTTIGFMYDNIHFGVNPNAYRTSSIIKAGNAISFTIGGFKRTYYDESLNGVKAAKITFTLESWSTAESLLHNGIYWAKFVKNNCSTWKDIPNKFSANDVVTADCKNGEIYLNGVLAPELGALGNDWEDFTLTPGLNQIGVSYSDWVADGKEPTFKIRYREVFL